MDLQIKGKTALITGGSVGIGLAVAEGLAREGVNLVLCARDEERLQKQAQRIKKEWQVEVLGVPADVAKSNDLDRLVSVTKEKCGGVDILSSFLYKGCLYNSITQR